MEAIGQQLRQGGAVAAPEGPRERAASYAERRAVRESRLQPAAHDALRLRREAEDARDAALDHLGTSAADLLLGEGSEEDVREAMSEVDAAEREVRKWTLALRALDEERGVIRAPGGEVLR